MNLIPTWDVIRVIGKSKLVGLTALVPFVGYLLLFNDTITNSIGLSPTFAGSASSVSQTISRLYYIYFGLTFLGVSSILYAFFCPKEIKENSSEYEYTNKEVNVMTHSRLRKFSEMYQALLPEGTEPFKEVSVYFNSYKDSYKRACEVHTTEQGAIDYGKEIEFHAKLDILRFHWNYANSTMCWLRALITAFYGIGFTLVLIPSASVFVIIVGNVLAGKL